jgi:DNA-directed RNA polymerase subunit K/omega
VRRRQFQVELDGQFGYSDILTMPQHVEPADPAADGSEPVEPITSRFLFVDVAAQRAKQLRRGALPRLERSTVTPHKLERLAMEEVRQGAIAYTLPTVEEVQRGRGRTPE